MNVGSDVMIVGGVSHFEHGRIVEIDERYEIPFALVTLRRKDGKLSQKQTLVPLKRCHVMPDHVIKMHEDDRQAWMHKWHKGAL